MTLGESLDPGSTFRQPIKATNDGYLPVFDAHFFCCLHQVEITTDLGAHYVIENAVTEYMGARTKILRPHESRTIICGSPKGRAQRADVALIVTYSPWPGLFRTEEVERYLGTPDAGGILRLHEQPSEALREVCLGQVAKMEAMHP